MEDTIPQKRWRRMWHYDVPIRPWNMPREPGCYAIYLDNNIVYIGQSSNIFDRICSHEIRFEGNVVITPWATGYTVRCKYKLSVRHGDWLMREARLIRRLQPPGNKRGNKSWRARVA